MSTSHSILYDLITSITITTIVDITTKAARVARAWPCPCPRPSGEASRTTAGRGSGCSASERRQTSLEQNYKVPIGRRHCEDCRRGMLPLRSESNFARWFLLEIPLSYYMPICCRCVFRRERTRASPSVGCSAVPRVKRAARLLEDVASRAVPKPAPPAALRWGVERGQREHKDSFRGRPQKGGGAVFS